MGADLAVATQEAARLRVLGALILFTGCASGGHPSTLEFTNAPGCAEVVAAHREDPSLPVQVLASPLEISIPSARQAGSYADVRFTVLETGAVDPESIVVDGRVSTATEAALIATATRFRYRPARVGDCWVASESSWSWTG